jgi:hypothetical protein
MLVFFGKGQTHREMSLVFNHENESEGEERDESSGVQNQHNLELSSKDSEAIIGGRWLRPRRRH